jgi:hypothetical protein
VESPLDLRCFRISRFPAPRRDWVAQPSALFARSPAELQQARPEGWQDIAS